MIHRHERSDAVPLQRIEEPVIKIQSRLIDRLVSLRANARPRHRKSVITDSQPRHQRDIFFEPVIVITGHVERVAVQHLAWLTTEGIPRGRRLALEESSAFYLRRRRGDAPDEIFRER